MMYRVNETDAIRNIQTWLRQLSYHDPEIPAVPIDGIWGTETGHALRAFQQLSELPVTGVVDRATHDALYLAYRESVALYSVPEPVPLFPLLPDDFSYGDGDRSEQVRMIQFMLNELGVLYEDLGLLDQDGIYGPATQTAVRRFQFRNQLPEGDRVDAETWNAIVREFRKVNLDGRQ